MFGYLRSLLIVALLSGSVAGLISWGVHMVGTTPLILQAEIFEAPAVQPEDGHDHNGTTLSPTDGWERNLSTLGADIVTGVGFAMLLVAGFVLFGRRIDLGRGLLWGLGGFAAFTLAPSIGLPPELPGTEAGPLIARQAWWLLTSVSTILGMAAFFKVRRPMGWIVGACLIALPHIVGAPQPTEEISSAPENLQQLFIWVAIGSGLAFWLALGALAGLSYKRLAGDIPAT